MSIIRNRLYQFKQELLSNKDRAWYSHTNLLTAVDLLITDLDNLDESDWIRVNDEMPVERDSMFAKFKGTNKWKTGMFEKVSRNVLVTVEYDNGERHTEVAHTVDGMMVGQRKSEKEKIDRRLHNTDLLLRNYRTLKASYENAVYKSKEGEVTEVLEDIMTMKDDKVIVESIKTSAKRTAIMVQHIDKMLDVYRIYCSKLSEKDKRRYKIIKALYISKTPMTIAEISKKFSVSKVTVYEDIKIAKERLSSLFFGIDGLKFF